MRRTRRLLAPLIALLGEVRAEHGLFARSTLTMTAAQVSIALVSGASVTIATAVIAGSGVAAWLIAGLLAAVVSAAVFTWVESWLSHVLAYRVIHRLRLRAYDAIERLVPVRSGRRRTGEMAGTAMADLEALEWFYAHTLGAGLNALLSPLLISIALVALVGPVGLIVPLGIAALLSVPWILLALQERQGAAIRIRVGALQAAALEGEEARRELATLGLWGEHRARILELTARLQRAKRRFALRGAAETALADAIIALTSLGFVGALVTASLRGELAAVLIPAALVLATAAIAPAAGAFAMVQRIGEMSAAAGRMLDLLARAAEADGLSETEAARAQGHPAMLPAETPSTIPTPTPASTPSPAPIPAPGGAGALRLEGVEFGYDGGPPVLDGLSLDIAAGETIALVGASGAGKTTVARLLTRLWEPGAGRILLDGAPIDRAHLAALRREIALVPQHPFVFRGTVRENLALAAPEASEAELLRALRDAGLAETLAEWPEGIDQTIGDRGATLSGGQRQRLSIAQALLRDPAVLILDEASAHLDALNERDIARAVARLREGRTTIVIAHRVSTIRRAPRVVMIAGGRVVADGSHEALLRDSPPYRALIARDEEPATAGPTADTPEGR